MSQKPKSRRKTTKIEQTPTLPTQNPTPPELHFAIARIAVSQISQSVGYKSTKHSALETLTHIAVKYIGAVASASASYAAMAKRTNTNVFDFANALHDLQSVQGFRGASALHENGFCVLGSSVLGDLAGFVRWNRETPFAGPIPRVEKLGAEKRGNEVPIPPELDSRRGLHVPRWLPAFPDMGKAVGKRRNGEELWENVVASNGGSGVGGGGEGESGNGKGNCRESVGKSKRGRVRFRVGGGEEESGVVGGMGVDLRSGVCRGGKRVSWSNSKIGYTNFSTRTRIHEFDDDDDGDKR
ncbi:hypothetical protein C1H46_010916 [Malus baccata]|uniref:Bromodomain associated domain-containing protein n=1 Tax=Malus baccata TaxID=106549 RepID=A0A540MXB0_MALBA|nr:hypothetical protein C1H46_010916 [Malus baccata]